MSVRTSWLCPALLGVLAAAAPGAIHYEVIDLGSGVAKAISDRNHVAGYYPVTMPGPYGYPVTRQRGLYWTAGSGRVQFTRDSIVQENDLDLYGWDINNSGYVAVREQGYYPRQWVYHGPTQTQYGDLTTLHPPGITDDLLLVGSVPHEQLPNGLWRYHAKARRGTGGVFDLVNYPYWSTASHYVTAVNNREVVIAQNGVGENVSIAFLPQTDGSWSIVGLEGAEADGSGWRYARGLNDRFSVLSRGMVVGEATSSAYGSQEVACYWDNALECHVIGRLGASGVSCANGVNGAGQIVGTSQDGGAAYRGFLYYGGTMHNINDLLADGAPAVTITALHDINTAGWIVGQTASNAVLLVPVYLDDGDFQLDDLTAHWTVSGSATTQETTPGEYCAALTATSPTTISQEIVTPVTDYDLEFEYRFLTADPAAVLTVALEGTELAVLHAPDPVMADWASHVVRVTDPALQHLDPGTLSFTYDGPAGTQLLLDNIAVEQVPEPTTTALLALGALALAALRRRVKTGRPSGRGH
jgi:probable HAF family extracellular repeat protein